MQLIPAKRRKSIQNTLTKWAMMCTDGWCLVFWSLCLWPDGGLQHTQSHFVLAREGPAAHLASRKKRHPVWRRQGHCATLMYVVVSVCSCSYFVAYEVLAERNLTKFCFKCTGNYVIGNFSGICDCKDLGFRGDYVYFKWCTMHYMLGYCLYWACFITTSHLVLVPFHCAGKHYKLLVSIFHTKWRICVYIYVYATFCGTKRSSAVCVLCKTE